VAVHLLCIDGWMTIITPSTKLERCTQVSECSIPPDDAVAEAFRRRRRGERPNRVSLQKNFDTQRIPSLQPLVDEPGADAII
jgi:hypothetical protein